MNLIKAVVIGGSAGSLDALFNILPGLPSNYSIPIILVVHLSPDHPNLLPKLLKPLCQLEVKEAEDKEPIRPAVLYIAPPNYHLLIEREHSLSLSADEKVQFSRPSIDVLFESAADAYGKTLVGVLLTGANEDGALGLARIRAAGGTTIVQSPETATVQTMPRGALRRDPQHRVVALSQIAEALAELAKVSR